MSCSTSRSASCALAGSLWCERRSPNFGADAASAPIHFALSSHCHLPRKDYIERSLRFYERSDVAAVGEDERVVLVGCERLLAAAFAAEREPAPRSVADVMAREHLLERAVALAAPGLPVNPSARTPISNAAVMAIRRIAGS